MLHIHVFIHVAIYFIHFNDSTNHKQPLGYGNEFYSYSFQGRACQLCHYYIA